MQVKRKQQFDSFNEWVDTASFRLTAHRDYGPEFQAICVDAKARHCRTREDFIRARDENAFPVRWIWPDQIDELFNKERKEK